MNSCVLLTRHCIFRISTVFSYGFLKSLVRRYSFWASYARDQVPFKHSRRLKSTLHTLTWRACDTLRGNRDSSRRISRRSSSVGSQRSWKILFLWLARLKDLRTRGILSNTRKRRTRVKGPAARKRINLTYPRSSKWARTKDLLQPYMRAYWSCALSHQISST